MSDSEQYDAEPEDDGIDGIGPFLGGIAIGTVLVGIVWGFVSVAGGHSHGSGDAGQANLHGAVGGPAQGSPADETDAASSRTDRCIEAQVLLALTIQQARPAMAQWELHIGAMNKLVVGAISLQQASEFWK